MSNLAFSCPWCGQYLEAPPDMSGDVPDFEVMNVYRPTRVRRQIEEVVFGRESVDYSPGPAPEVDGGE